MVFMGKAIDALEELMMKIEYDGALFLDEAFMSDIFSNIMEGDNKLEPLEEYIIHMFGKYSIQISLRIICLINFNI